LSATNRGSKRIESDFYPTPLITIDSFLDNYRLKDGTILEPCAGNGNLIGAIRGRGYTDEIVANEIRESEHDNLASAGANYIYHEDFLNVEIPSHDVRTIITNPPFNLAKEFILRSKELYPNAEVIMLLRLAFLESKSRLDFWKDNNVDELYILSQRPKFINNKSDATAYAWFVWNNSGKQKIKVI